MAFTVEEYKSSLTSEQKKAAWHERGPACVIAGAGTGKTLTLTEHICWLIEKQHLDPTRVLVTTFTRKATAELYNRTYGRLGDCAQRIKISTIDALIWDLAQHASQRGYMSSARLIEEATQRLLLFQCAWEVFGQRDDYFKSRWIENADKAGLINLLGMCLRAEIAEGLEKQTLTRSIKRRLKESQRRWSFRPTLRKPNSRDIRETLKKYFEKLQALKATDYDLLSRDFLHCMRKHKNLVAVLAKEFDSILVDEFQDTSRAQAEILLLLSGKNRNIWVVGDPCQQIYEWRGAGPENLVWFVEKSRARKYYLTENWRSKQPVLDCTYRFLSRRVPSLKKKGMLKPLKSMRDGQPPLNDNEAVFLGKLDQALWLVKHLLESRPNLKPSDIAILSRELSRKDTLRGVEEKAKASGLKVQFHSSRADRAAAETIGDPPPPRWSPQNRPMRVRSKPANG